MTLRSSKRAVSSSEEVSLSDSYSDNGHEKTIPFLRRLKQMLVENEESIAFIPGRCQNGRVTLGRLVVRDRIIVETVVLPRYFNHSSFASLRRQLNYFSFTKVGKGRARESMYVNKEVMELDDILHLRRRPAGTAPPTVEEVLAVERKQISTNNTASFVDAIVPVIHLSMKVNRKARQSTKRHRMTKLPLSNHRSVSPIENFISEDELSQDRQHVSLDLTASSQARPDDEMLAGCTALLGLAGKGWD